MILLWALIFLNIENFFDKAIEVIMNFSNVVFTQKNLDILYFILSIFAIFCITVIIYSIIRIFEVRKKQHEHMHHEIAEYAHHKATSEKESRKKGSIKNERWKKVLDYLFSHNENDWKLAVIESDTMLFDLLTQLKFKGDTLGDKLKGADRDSFHYLTAAWEAHSVRNKIAHEGSSFYLPLKEAKRVVALYEQIFSEFGYI